MLLDSGNFSDNPTPAGDLKTSGLLQAMDRLGYQVVNVGERDIRMGYSEFARRTAGTPFQYVSANIVDRKTKQPIFAPHTVVEAVSPNGKSRVRVGVIGIVRYNPMFLKSGPDGNNMVIVHPRERVEVEMEALKDKGVDVIVLLAGLNKIDAKTIAGEIPGIDFVLGSYGGMITSGEETAGDASILYCGNRGQRIGESRVFFADGDKTSLRARSNKLHLLTRHYPPDHEMLEFVNALPREPESTDPPASSSLPAVAPARSSIGP